MTDVFIRREKKRYKDTLGKGGQMMMEAETGVLKLPAKELQGLLVTTEAGKSK